MDFLRRNISNFKFGLLIFLVTAFFLEKRIVFSQDNIKIKEIHWEDKRSEGNLEFIFISFPAPGWYMISLPLQVADSSATSIFPTSLGVFEWKKGSSPLQDHYEMVSALKTGIGYWVAMPAPTTVVLSGAPIKQFNMHCQVGWNFIGSVIDSVDFSNPNDSPDNSILLPLYHWNLEKKWYDPSYTIRQSKGYWMAVLQECDVTVGNDSIKILAKANETKLKNEEFYRQFGSQPPPPPPFVFDKKLENIIPIPELCKLLGNYPNPFNPETNIKYELGNATTTSLVIYNALGKVIRTLVDTYQQRGSYEVLWDGRNNEGEQMSSGVYFYKIITNNFTETKKMILIR